MLAVLIYVNPVESFERFYFVDEAVLLIKLFLVEVEDVSEVELCIFGCLHMGELDNVLKR